MKILLTDNNDIGWGISPRGAGVTFGPDTIKKWNEANKLKLIIRGHQFVKEVINLLCF